MRTILWLIPVSAFLVNGCNSAPPPPPFKPVADVKQLMIAIEPLVDVIWDATGTIVTAAGIEERRPKSQADWDAVRNSAIILAETGNLLMMVPRAKDGDVWMKRSQELIDTSVAAWRAADAKNVDALFNVGGDIYQACARCHQEYMEGARDAGQ